MNTNNEEAANKLIKTIGGFAFRSTTLDGRLAKTYICVFENGIVGVKRLVLTDTPISDWKLLGTKFGKHLYANTISFKYSSFYFMNKTVTEILMQHHFENPNHEQYE